MFLDLPDIYNFCLLVGFLGEKAQILHAWKVQVYFHFETRVWVLNLELSLHIFEEKKLMKIIKAQGSGKRHAGGGSTAGSSMSGARFETLFFFQSFERVECLATL